MSYRQQIHELTIEILTQLVDQAIICVIEILPAQAFSGHETVERLNLNSERATAQKAHEQPGHLIAAVLADDEVLANDEDAIL